MAFHVRVTLSRVEAPQVSKQIVDFFKPSRYICGYEEVDTNHHMHMHLEFDEPATAVYLVSDAGKSYKSAFFKKIGYAGKYYFKECIDQFANKLYVAKDLDIICHNYEEEDYDEIMNATNKINDNKKLDQRNKLLAAFREEFKELPKFIQKPNSEEGIEMFNPERPHRLTAIASWIHWHYIDVYDKPPPTIHMREYVLWIASKEEVMDTDSYYLMQFHD